MDPPLDALRSPRRSRTDVGTLNGVLGGTETQTDVLVPSAATLARAGALCLGLGVLEDVRLLLESTLALDGQLGRPVGNKVSISAAMRVAREGSYMLDDLPGKGWAFVELRRRLKSNGCFAERY